MQQETLFHEDIWEALSTDIMAAGGWKEVGHALHPKKSPQAAAEYLKCQVNPVRAEKLDAEEIALIKKLAKAKNSFATHFFECDDLGMTHGQSIEPEDEKARLQREFIETGKSMKGIWDQLAKLGVE